MSDLPARREKVVFPNPGIASERWFLDISSSPLTRFVPSLPLAAGLLFSVITLILCLIYNISLLLGGEVILGAAFWFGLLLFGGLEQLVMDKVSKKRESYRREHVQLLIDALANQGWSIYGKEAIDTLIDDDFPYFFSQKNSFRYKTYQRSIGTKIIEWTFELSDDKAALLIKEDAKQKKIALMTEKYEKQHGVLSPEEKATFQNALKLTL